MKWVRIYSFKYSITTEKLLFDNFTVTFYSVDKGQ